ncbi:hypothetical protein [Pseudomonas nabeulensis]|uniref:hypothetical protein n=1 Tax=Pseudomonas nabeulensis TaxID=2293833 RepID=UPI001EE9AC6D|nr:hypothetical protein [Pseudomonas nabeulensis]
MHSIDGLAVLEGDEYRQKGGGSFARWQQHITGWHCNLYYDLERAPAIGECENLIVSAIGPEPLIEMGFTPEPMWAVALEKCPENRWLAKLDSSTSVGLGALAKNVQLYAPMTVQLTSHGTADAGTESYLT